MAKPGYPKGAIYTYYDSTCNFRCQGFEYFYWVLTSILGSQELRKNAIIREWRATTKDEVKTKNPLGYALFTNDKYIFPKTLPNGVYCPTV